MEEEQLYDEFGNYIGPDLEEEQSEEEVDEAAAEQFLDDFEGEEKSEDEEMKDANEAEEQFEETAIVLHEDKKYYPTAEEIYTSNVETLVQEEDTQPLEVPIVAPVVNKDFHLFETEVPETIYQKEYMEALSEFPEMMRNIALVGNLHSGKTAFMDMVIQQTVVKNWDLKKEIRYTDTLKNEQARGISIKSCPVSLLLPSTSEKSHILHMIDTPGHTNFSDEVSAAFRLVDGAVVFVDAVEGVTMHTEQLIRHAIQNRLAITLVINKIDRLVLELRLPPNDAFHKLRHTVDHFNSVLAMYSFGEEQYRVSPVLGSVLFASSLNQYCFTLPSFAKLYIDSHELSVSVDDFAKRLWGDVYRHPDGKFRRTPPASGADRTFVHFILNPLYKLYTQCIGESQKQLQSVCNELGFKLSNEEAQMDVKPLMKVVFQGFLGGCESWVDMVRQFVPSPARNAVSKVEATYTGPLDDEIAEGMLHCRAEAPLMVSVSKLYAKPDCETFQALGRVMSGVLRLGQPVKVLGENYTLEDDEDSAHRTVTALSFAGARFNCEIPTAYPGNLVLLDGVDTTIIKTATLTQEEGADEAFVFKPLTFMNAPVCKLAIEPLVPSELPKMIEGIRRCNKSFPILRSKVEESGEHVLMGTGELYLDSVMHDLRKMYSGIEIKASDPAVAFCETVEHTSSLKCFSETPNRMSKLTMIAEPLERGLAEDIEAGNVNLVEWPKKKVREFFQTKYDWDVLAARSVWAFGPELNGPNVLLDDTLASEVDKKLLGGIRDHVVQGFQWAAREGPLCDEPLRNCKFKLLDATIAPEPIHRGGNQIIPTARRVAYSSFLLASPRLMEPVFSVEITCTPETLQAVHDVLARRRGHVIQELHKPGSPASVITAYIPVIDSYGFETDLRVHTQGAAFCLSVFDHWQNVPGDPLDKSVQLRPLEPSAGSYLARDFMVKTRRRKGLSEDVSVNKFFDDPMLLELAREENLLM